MLELIISGIIQGVVEWLPVSSEGIISLFLQNYGYSLQEAVDISLFLHLGTLIATISFFWKDIKKISHPKKRSEINLLLFLFWTTIVSVIVAGPLYFLINHLSSISGTGSIIIGALLIITGLLQYIRKELGSKKEAKVEKTDALVTGFSQGFAILPGISRSGSTTLALLVRGFDMNSALRLSFFVSMPVIFISQIVLGVFKGFYFKPDYLLAALMAFIVGRLSIGFLLKTAEKINFSLFCIILGVLSIVF